jgi:hypothetical protein
MRLLGLAIGLLAVLPYVASKRGRLPWPAAIAIAAALVVLGGAVAGTIAVPLALIGFLALLAANDLAMSSERLLGASLGVIGFGLMLAASYLIRR